MKHNKVFSLILQICTHSSPRSHREMSLWKQYNGFDLIRSSPSFNYRPLTCSICIVLKLCFCLICAAALTRTWTWKAARATWWRLLMVSLHETVVLLCASVSSIGFALTSNVLWCRRRSSHQLRDRGGSDHPGDSDPHRCFDHLQVRPLLDTHWFPTSLPTFSSTSKPCAVSVFTFDQQAQKVKVRRPRSEQPDLQ